MANGNKLLDQKAIDTIIDSILKAVEIKSNKKSSEGRGKDGKDGRDGENAPQINDDEALSTNPWSGLKTKEEIAKVEGKIYPCTAQALEDMTQEQQAELYTQGYRAIKTENNETVVTLALASDGSLEWLGCNQPRGSLTDNENFAIAQAGYGGAHGTQVYAADRWKGSGTGATFAAGSGGGLTITCGTGAAGCSQVIADPPDVGEYFSFVVVSGNTTVIAAGSWTGTAQDATATGGALTATVTDGSVQISVASGSATVDYCMLLYGSYTPKTLLPWETPTYMTELVKCLGRYQIIYVSLFAQNIYQAYAPRFNTLVAMMGTPTVTLYTTDKQTQGFLSREDGTDEPASVNAVNITNTGCNIQSTAGNFVAGKQYNGFIAFSYDL